MASDPNDFRTGDLEYSILRKILGRLKETQEINISTQDTISLLPVVADPFFQTGLSGEINGKPALVFHVKGRRAGFNTANIRQDIGEFLGTSADLFPELDGTETLELVSSSAQDSAAGTGTRTLRLVYIDLSNNLVQSAPITLNGTTPVAVPFKMKFSMWMEAATGGSGETSIGTILLRIVGGATQDQISPNENRSLAARFMVPQGFSAYISFWSVTSTGPATHDARLRAKVNDLSRALEDRYTIQDLVYTDSTQALVTSVPFLKFPPLCKIKVSTIPSATGATNKINTVVSILLVAN